MPTEAEGGLYEKYKVERRDGGSEEGGKHHGCEYFVLDLDDDPYGLAALRAYEVALGRTGQFQELQHDLRLKISEKILANSKSYQRAQELGFAHLIAGPGA